MARASISFESLRATGCRLTPCTSCRNGVSTRYSVSGGVYDACTGEIIDVTADVTLVMTYHEDKGGGFHKVENYVMHGKGVGRTSGIEYIYVDSHNMRVNGEAP